MNSSVIATAFWSNGLELTVLGWLVGFLVLLGVVSALGELNWRKTAKQEPAVFVRAGMIFGMTVIGLVMLSSVTAFSFALGQ
jgi:hypothetical protein